MKSILIGAGPVNASVRRLSRLPAHTETKKPDEMRLTIAQVDLLEQDVDVIINAWN